MSDTAIMPAVLLAAGLGTRLRPLTNAIPKCLVPIGGQPLLGHWLSTLRAAGVGPLIVNMHHHAQAVRAYLQESGWNTSVLADFEEELLGTAGTLYRHRKLLEGGPFLAIHADNYSIFNVQAFIAAHADRPAACDITMMTFETPTPKNCGIVKLDERGVIIDFYEKVENPPGKLANGAVYVMEPSVLETIQKCRVARPDISLDVIPQHLGRIFAYHNDGYHRDIGTPESYAQAQADHVAMYGVAASNKI